MLQQISQWFFRKSLPVRRSSAPAYAVNPAKQIQILFDGTKEEDRDVIAAFCKKLSKVEKRQVRCLAFVDQKEPCPDDRFTTFCRKDANWYGKPISDQVSSFWVESPDILLVFCVQLVPPIEYVLASSQAVFVVGPNVGNAHLYCHLLAEVGENSTMHEIIKGVMQAIDVVSMS
jgi:hypothetical protein